MERTAKNGKDEMPSKVLKYLFLGGKQHAKERDTLRHLKITYILNCTPPKRFRKLRHFSPHSVCSVDPEAGCPNFFEKDSSLTYKRIALFDNKGEDLLGHMEAVYQFIEHARHHGNVLVHCHKGISRSASFVIGYLMRKNEMTFEEALAHVQSVRPMVQPNDSFLEQLRRYEVSLSEKRDREQEAQHSFNLKMDERASKRARVEVAVGPMLPMPSPTPLGPSVDPSMSSDDREFTTCDPLSPPAIEPCQSPAEELPRQEPNQPPSLLMSHAASQPAGCASNAVRDGHENPSDRDRVR
jgi:protein-tyrosine phosphatase